MGINASLAQTIKELDMQLRKLATAMLVMGMSAGLAHAEDAAPAAGSAMRTAMRQGMQKPPGQVCFHSKHSTLLHSFTHSLTHSRVLESARETI